MQRQLLHAPVEKLGDVELVLGRTGDLVGPAELFRLMARLTPGVQSFADLAQELAALVEEENLRRGGSIRRTTRAVRPREDGNVALREPVCRRPAPYQAVLMMRSSLAVVVLLAGIVTTAGAAELTPRAAAAFDQYVRLTDAKLGAEPSFLRIDRLPPSRRADVHRALSGGEVHIERVASRGADIPDALLHHWVGTVFVPGASVSQAVALLQHYDRHAGIYTPSVARSRLLSRSGDHFRVYLRFAMTRGITVVVNSEHSAVFARPAPDRAQSRIVSTRIAEVEDPNTPAEREKPVGRDSGYLWRLNTYWRMLERGGGVYLQCESITLTRDIPTGLGWLIRPFITSIPRDTLAFTLETTRHELSRLGAKQP